MAAATKTPFTRLFDLRVPIVQAPMGGVAGPALVSAAANAGALGVLPIWYLPPEAAVALVQQTRTLTDRPFAVNVRADLHQADLIAAALDAGASMVHLFWGDPAASMQPIRNRDARMIATVWDSDSARRAADAGACAVIAQGVEAGGHVIGTIPLYELLPMVRSAVGDLPVAAAGGLADAEDVAKVLAAGADAAALGTRFAATAESEAHDDYKRALIEAAGDATVRSVCFDGEWPDAPHRTLRNSTYQAWHAAGQPAAGARPGEGDVVLRDAHGAYERYHMTLPTLDMTGDWEAAALYAGAGVSKVADAPPVAEVIDRITASLR
jgi:NAD(P)H-dependent flavin oxidoreductase YrpB (nitropropane dioxygenase family)